jgi:plasmid stabilization system protein ParE
MKVEITALAEADLAAIYQRIWEDSPTRAAEWRGGLLQAAQALEQLPLRCPLAPESGAALEIRQLLYGRYRVLFTITLKLPRFGRHLISQETASGACHDETEATHLYPSV